MAFDFTALKFAAPDADAHARRWEQRMTLSFNFPGNPESGGWIECSSLNLEENLMKESASHFRLITYCPAMHGEYVLFPLCSASSNLQVWMTSETNPVFCSLHPWTEDLRRDWHGKTRVWDRWRLDTLYRSWGWRRTVCWRTLWDPSHMCRNTAAHLGRAENSTGKTQVTLALLQDCSLMSYNVWIPRKTCFTSLQWIVT